EAARQSRLSQGFLQRLRGQQTLADRVELFDRGRRDAGHLPFVQRTEAQRELANDQGHAAFGLPLGPPFGLALGHPFGLPLAPPLRHVALRKSALVFVLLGVHGPNTRADLRSATWRRG